MSLASPQNELERRIAGEVDGIHDRAWNEAIDAAVNVVAQFQSKGVQPIIDELLALKTEAGESR